MTAPHEHRQTAESFGSEARRYDRTRPPYPAAVVDGICAAAPGRDVLDVGCGTGIEGRQFRDAGCTVLGVEPDARMAELARRSGLAVEEATFETWDPAGRTFDAVVAGTSWHWVDPLVGATKAAQVLRPGGRLAPFHHVFAAPPELVDAFAEVYRLTAGSGAREGMAEHLARSPVEAYQPLFDRMADGMRQADGLGEPEQWHVDWDRVYTRDEWLDQIPTLGGAAALPPDDLARALDVVGTAIDAVGGRFTMRYRTVVVTAARTAVRLRSA
jgi:SAM-dependent methyltransferase